jgi:hypothetical protein
MCPDFSHLKTLQMDIIQMAQGNPGAINCLIQVADSDKGALIIDTLQSYNIKGTDIYVLWSDICDRNVELMAYLCNVVPGHQLAAESAKQDRSGVEALSHYLQGYNDL